jgi:hypothetical protein
MHVLPSPNACVTHACAPWLCRPKSDPHAQTINDSYDVDEYGRICALMAGGQAAADQLGWRGAYRMALAQLTVQLLHHTVTRGDDSRLLRICHIGKPKIATTVGPCEAKFVNIVLDGSKTSRVSTVVWCHA